MMQGYSLIGFVLGLAALVIAISVMVDVYTNPETVSARQAKDHHFQIPTWADRFQKKHFHLHLPRNTHKHRRH